MIVSTADIIPGAKVEILGLVKGNIVTSKNVGRDIMASAKSFVGGEIKSYTEMTNEARSTAESRMVEQAESMGANAVVCCRFAAEAVMEGTTEMLCYGTAVKYL